MQKIFTQAKWLTAPEFLDAPVNNLFHRQLEKIEPSAWDLSRQNKHLLFRKKFDLPAEALQTPVKLFITADDYYKLYINGKFVAMGPAPGYHFHYFCNEIDVTDFLCEGENTIAVHTYYQGLINRVWVSGDNRHGMICELESNGKVLLASDESFLLRQHSAYTDAGTVGYETQYLERYDASAPECGFEQPGFDDSGWEHAVVKTDADYQFHLQVSQMLVQEEIRPVKTIRRDNVLFVDFGGIYVGSLAVRAAGKKGDTITIRCGQELNQDGSVRWQMRCNCNYQEYFVLSGGENDILNQFDFKSFRYTELELPEGVSVSDVTLLARHYPFELKAVLNRQDERSKQIWKLCTETLHWGVQEVIQDCMDREKGYYLGDGCYSLFTFCLLTQDYTLMEKFFDDFFRTSFINRGLMTCANCSFMQEIAEYPLIMITFAMVYLEMTGNESFIRERFAKFADILDFYREEYAQENGLLCNLDKWCVVEWPAPLRDGYDVDITEGKVCTVMHNVINAYYIGAVKCMNKMAARLGLPPYADAEKLTAAFQEAFYLPEKKMFRDSVDSDHISMPGNIFAWFYELVPDVESFKRELLPRIREARMRKSVLFEGFPLLTCLLRDGEQELAFELLTDDGAWMNMLKEGATRTFESWGADWKWNTSLFHLTLSYGAAFLTDWPLKKIMTF